MKPIQLTDYQQQLIEELGVLYQKNNLPPAASRILALLFVSDQTELTFEQIRGALKISKSATSSALNLLLVTKHLIYFTKPNDRKRYFCSGFKNWGEKIRQLFEQLDDMIVVLKKILGQRPTGTNEFNQNLGRLIQFIEFVSGEIPTLFQKWDQQNREPVIADSPVNRQRS